MILRRATLLDKPIIWAILQQGIEQRKQEGSNQWQNGYPNEQSVHNDIISSSAYVFVNNSDEVVACAAIIFDIDPAYNDIKGSWITNGTYAVIHRLATAQTQKGKGIATLLFKAIESLCVANNVPSIRVDTNFDNTPMLKILDNLQYIYCGEVIMGGGIRKAYEKVIT